MSRIKLLIGTIGLAAALPLAQQAPAAAATHAVPGVQIYYNFTPAHPRFHKTDHNGKFSAQVTYKSKGLPMAWSFRLAEALQDIATGEMNCKASLEGTKRYHDHHVIPVNSLWHSTVPGNKYDVKYVLQGTCTFPVEVGGQPGTATVSFKFHFVIKK